MAWTNEQRKAYKEHKVAEYALTAPKCGESGCPNPAVYGHAGLCRSCHRKMRSDELPTTECVEPECLEPAAYGRGGYCQSHYRQHNTRASEMKRKAREKFSETAPECAEEECTSRATYGCNGYCSAHYQRLKYARSRDKANMSDPTASLTAHDVSLRYARVFDIWSSPNKSVGSNPKSEDPLALEKSAAKGDPIIWDLHYKYTMGIGLDVAAPSPDSGERWEMYQKWLPIQRQVQARRRSAQKLIAPNYRGNRRRAA